MPIRYCTATSKRTKKPCRARAMRGRNVCYHHGGKSRRGFTHPKFEHGYYSKDGTVQLLLSMAFSDYRRALRQQQIADVLDELNSSTSRLEKWRDYQRFMARFRAEVARLPHPRLTPELAAYVMRWRWPGWMGS